MSERRAINFDLDTAKLKKYYPSSFPLGYRKAYTDIKNFLESNGFEHRQYSGYVSKEEMKDFETTAVICKLSVTFPWLRKCINKIDVTVISDEYDLINAVLDPTVTIHELKKINDSDPKKGHSDNTFISPTSRSRSDVQNQDQ